MALSSRRRSQTQTRVAQSGAATAGRQTNDREHFGFFGVKALSSRIIADEITVTLETQRSPRDASPIE